MNTLAEIQREWDLTIGEARGLLYALVSQATIDKCLDHPKNGGPLLALDILLIRFDLGANELAAQIEAKHDHERRREESRRESERRFASALSARAGDNGEAAEGQIVDLQGRSFDRP